MMPGANRGIADLMYVRRLVSQGAFPLAVLMALATTASAHQLGGPMGGFGSGFEHPLLGGDHFLAMLAVGLWGAQMGGRSVWTLPATFPMIMCVGGVLGMMGLIPDTVVIMAIAISLIVLGSVIALKWKAPEPVAIIIIAFFAIFHGYAHGRYLPAAADPAAYAVGFVVATGLIHVAGVGIGLLLGRYHQGRIIRLGGAFIALAGIYYLLA
jgi:urease accessory protein